jgi:hypothetical protein
MEMRTFDHDGKRWWVVGDDRGAVSIHAVPVPADFHRPTVIRDRDGVRMYPDCITYHRPVADGTDGTHADCPALNGRTCDPDAGQRAYYFLGQWEMLGHPDHYLAETLTGLYAREWPAAKREATHQTAVDAGRVPSADGADVDGEARWTRLAGGGPVDHAAPAPAVPVIAPGTAGVTPSQQAGE